jgi:hypothetical protein
MAECDHHHFHIPLLDGMVRELASGEFYLIQLYRFFQMVV